MAQIHWQEAQHALQTGSMDLIHHEFVALTNALAVAADATEIIRLERLLGHCRDHFAQERMWMEISHMPSTEHHLQDHDAIMAMLEAAMRDLRAGRHGAGRDVTDRLVPWFEQHSSTLDAALAFHLQKSMHKERPGIPAVG